MLANTKKYLVAGVGIAIVIAIAASFTSYLGQFEQLQQQDSGTTIYHDEVAVGKGSPLLGMETARVTIIEMGDYQCEMCKRWYDNTRPKIIENFVNTGKASLVFLDLPILGPDSKLAAEATYCAEDQGRFWDYHGMLYDFQGHMNSGWANIDRLNSFAFNLDLDMEEFNECMSSDKYEMRVKYNAQKAKSVGNSTPTFLIINTSGVQERIVGAQPYHVFEQVIESLL